MHLKNIWVQKFWVYKIFWVRKKFGSEKMFGPKKSLVWVYNLSLKKILGPKNFWVKNYFAFKIFLGPTKYLNQQKCGFRKFWLGSCSSRNIGPLDP